MLGPKQFFFADGNTEKTFTRTVQGRSVFSDYIEPKTSLERMSKENKEKLFWLLEKSMTETCSTSVNLFT